MAGRPARDHLLPPTAVRVLAPSLRPGPGSGTYLAKERYPGIAAHLRRVRPARDDVEVPAWIGDTADGPASVSVTARGA